MLAIGTISLVLAFVVPPSRSSRNTVTMRQQDHGIEAALQGARQFVHVAVVGGGDDV
jgi:hypothetical protein